MRRIDLTGKRFGKWQVIEYVKNKKWKCRCACGIETIVEGNNLRGNLSTKCRKCGPGFVKKLPFGESNFNDRYSNASRAAKIRNIEWLISKQEAKKIFLEDCYYCGSPPSQIWCHAGTNGNFVSNGIDRVDSTKGYVLENCVPCCKNCNYMKRGLTVKEFLDHIERISNHNMEAM